MLVRDTTPIGLIQVILVPVRMKNSNEEVGGNGC